MVEDRERWGRIAHDAIEHHVIQEWGKRGERCQEVYRTAASAVAAAAIQEERERIQVVVQRMIEDSPAPDAANPLNINFASGFRTALDMVLDAVNDQDRLAPADQAQTPDGGG